EYAFDADVIEGRAIGTDIQRAGIDQAASNQRRPKVKFQLPGDRDQPEVFDDFGIERIARTDGVDLIRIPQGSVLHRGRSEKVEGAVVGDVATQDAAAIERQRRVRIDRQLA